MRFDNDDALDAALFALPLEEPPSDLRSAILSATVLRPAPVFSFRELCLLGTLVSVLVWLTVAVTMGGGRLFVDTMETMGAYLASSLSNVATLAWIAVGGATALVASIFTGFQPRAKVKAEQQR
jgi:hypothetical protein